MNRRRFLSMVGLAPVALSTRFVSGVGSAPALPAHSGDAEPRGELVPRFPFGYVPQHPGGRWVRVAADGQGEYIIPVDRLHRLLVDPRTGKAIFDAAGGDYEQWHTGPGLVSMVARHGRLLHAGRVVRHPDGHLTVEALCGRINSMHLGPNHSRTFFAYEPETVMPHNCKVCELHAADLALRLAVAA